VHGHIFNQFTIDTTIAELERLQLINKGPVGYIRYPNCMTSYCSTSHRGSDGINTPDGTISEHEMKDLFDLKYGLTFLSLVNISQGYETQEFRI
jgi:hypothetical protein